MADIYINSNTASNNLLANAESSYLGGPLLALVVPQDAVVSGSNPTTIYIQES